MRSFHLKPDFELYIRSARSSDFLVVQVDNMLYSSNFSPARFSKQKRLSCFSILLTVCFLFKSSCLRKYHVSITWLLSLNKGFLWLGHFCSYKSNFLKSILKTHLLNCRMNLSFSIFLIFLCLFSFILFFFFYFVSWVLLLVNFRICFIFMLWLSFL